MELSPRQLLVYERLDGSQPYIDWLSLVQDARSRAIIAARLNRVALGLLGDHHDVSDGVWELRIHYGPGYRVYYGHWQNYTVLLWAELNEDNTVTSPRRKNTSKTLRKGTRKISREKDNKYVRAEVTVRGATDYDEILIERLRKDPAEACSYLQASFEDGHVQVFLMALRIVAQAYGGLGLLAERSGLNREALYRTLSSKGNPSLTTLSAVLRALGFELAIVPASRPPSNHTPTRSFTKRKRSAVV